MDWYLPSIVHNFVPHFERNLDNICVIRDILLFEEHKNEITHSSYINIKKIIIRKIKSIDQLQYLHLF